MSADTFMMEEIPRWCENTRVFIGQRADDRLLPVRVTTEVNGETFGFQLEARPNGIADGITKALERQALQIGRFIVYGRRP